jgi:hypothetical protein
MGDLGYPLICQACHDEPAELLCDYGYMCIVLGETPGADEDIAETLAYYAEQDAYGSEEAGRS